MISIVPFLKSSFLLAVTVMTLCGCDYKLKQSVEAYQGDGEIRYLKAPNFLGISGCEVEMPHFDLSKPFYAKYNLTGLPKAKTHYVVYLIVPGEYRQELPALFSLEIYKKGQKVKELSSLVKKLTNSYGGAYGPGRGDNRFYFHSYNDDQNMGGITVDEPEEEWRISVSCENSNLADPVDAYILISAGGFK